MKSLVFQQKYLVFGSKTLNFNQNTKYFESEIFQITSFLHLAFEILGISREIPSILKKGVKFRVFSGLYVCPPASGSVVPTDTETLSKYYTYAELDQQQKHSTPFVNSFSNPTRESGEVIYK